MPVLCAFLRRFADFAFDELVGAIHEAAGEIGFGPIERLRVRQCLYFGSGRNESCDHENAGDEGTWLHAQLISKSRRERNRDCRAHENQ